MLALAVLLSCGAPEADEPEPRIIIPGKITPYLHVEGDEVGGKVNPTGVKFDARPEGWRVSCLNGATPFVAMTLDGMRLVCTPPVAH